MKKETKAQIEICNNPYNDTETLEIKQSPGGIRMSFNNGNTISIQWGMNNFSSTRFIGDPSLTCTSAEIAIWDENGEWAAIDPTGGEVKGWVNPDEIARFISLTCNNTIPEINEIMEQQYATQSINQNKDE